MVEGGRNLVPGLSCVSCGALQSSTEGVSLRNISTRREPEQEWYARDVRPPRSQNDYCLAKRTETTERADLMIA